MTQNIRPNDLKLMASYDPTIPITDENRTINVRPSAMINISNITLTHNAPIKVTTSVAHNFEDDDIIRISGVSDTEIDYGYSVTPTGDTGNEFLLNGTVFTRSHPEYVSGGQLKFSRTIDSIRTTNNMPVQITTMSNHLFETGDQVTFSDDIGGTTELESATFTITDTGDTTFTLDGTNGANFEAYVLGSGGTVSSIIDIDSIRLTNNTPVQITSRQFVNGDEIILSNFPTMNGTENLNGTFFVSSATANTFNLKKRSDDTDDIVYTQNYSNYPMDTGIIYYYPKTLPVSAELNTTYPSGFTIFEEIVYLMRAILNAARDGKLEVTVSNETIMTASEDYYRVWQNADGTLPNERNYEQNMVAIIDHFRNLGYAIQQVIGENNKFDWKINW